jgi:hypothetical protein
MIMQENEQGRQKPFLGTSDGQSVPRLFLQQKSVRHLEERFIQRAIAQRKTIDEVIKELTPKSSSKCGTNIIKPL